MKRKLYCAVLSAVILLSLPVKAWAAELLVPVGQVVGLQLGDDTLTVAAYDDILGAPAREAGLKIGDELVAIDGSSVSCVRDVRTALTDSGEAVELTVRRGGKLKSLRLVPTRTGDGPRLGVYLRQGIAGIGTVTFYDPDTGLFGTLGHGVSTGKGELLRMTQGSACTASVLSVKKGRCGEPGQLKGSADGSAVVGVLIKNTPQGVFGMASKGWEGKTMPTADYEDIRTGPALIRSTIAGDRVQEYSVEILKIYPESRTDGRNFLLKVTDPELLGTTGGIVQGMSGSPLLQNGKIIGAVTHVLVNDPTTGYGIFIENMLEAAG